MTKRNIFKRLIKRFSSRIAVMCRYVANVQLPNFFFPWGRPGLSDTNNI